jgi:hypothetical protein
VPFLALLPIFAPVISVDRYVAFQKAIHYSPPISEHSHARSPLPQYYLMNSAGSRWCRGRTHLSQLASGDARKTGIKASDYGQAGAIDYFGPKYGLPKALVNTKTTGSGNAWLYR